MPTQQETPMNLEDAIIANDEARVRKLLPLYMQSDELHDGLRVAVMVGMPKMAELLLKAGADPDVRTPARDREAERRQARPIPPEEAAEMWASLEAYKKANPHIFNEYQDEYNEYSDLLITSIGPRVQNADLATPLIHVCESSFCILDPDILSGDKTYDDDDHEEWFERARRIQLELIEHLLAAGADIEARDSIGRTALLAAAYPNLPGVKLLFPDQSYVPLGTLPLRPTIERLLAAGADINACDEGGNTLLSKMARVDLDMLRFLLDAGARVDCRTTDRGETALHCAARDNNPEAVSILLAAGCGINERTYHNFVPLHHAVYGAHPKTPDEHKETRTTLQTLMAAGADINARGAKNRTPLHIAAAENVPAEIVHFLLDAGAAKDVVDELGATPYDLAARLGREGLLPILQPARQ